MDKRARRWFGLLGGFALIGCAPDALRAQVLVDPMRPPEALAPGAKATEEPKRGLQGAITSPGRKLALIDGTVVPLGSASRDGTLTGLSDNAAVLKKNGERDVLLMHPNIDKRPSRRQEQQ